MAPPSAYLFDAYGTLFDVHSVIEAGRALTSDPQALSLPASELLFVSSNAWDVAGAKAFGYRVAWCNRQDAPAEELGLSADVIVTSLAELPL